MGVRFGTFRPVLIALILIVLMAGLGGAIAIKEQAGWTPRIWILFLGTIGLSASVDPRRTANLRKAIEVAACIGSGVGAFLCPILVLASITERGGWAMLPPGEFEQVYVGILLGIFVGAWLGLAFGACAGVLRRILESSIPQ